MQSRKRYHFTISNNPAVWEFFPSTRHVLGSPLDVIRDVREHVHQGWKLAGHPLMGSIRLLCNPYRSVVMDASSTDIDSTSVLLVEDAYYRLSQVVFDKASTASLRDYQLIDLELLKAMEI